MARKHKKPTGTIGCICIFADGRMPELQQVPFPPEKAAVERMVVAYISTENDLGRFYALRSPPVQNSENDFDFTLPTTDGDARLELMEIAILGGGSYDAAPLSYNHGQLADAICSGIAKKSRRYGGRQRGLHLLVYSTDFRFRAANGVLWLVSKWCSTTPHAFASVVYIAFLDAQSADGKILHPQHGRDYSTVDELAVRKRRTIHANITKMEPTPDGHGFSIPLGPP